MNSYGDSTSTPPNASIILIIPITIPDKEVLSKIIKVIDKVESGKKLTDNDVKELN